MWDEIAGTIKSKNLTTDEHGSMLIKDQKEAQANPHLGDAEKNS